jgi:Baseplate J-like protein
MAKSAPKIDERTAAEIVADVRKLLAKNLPQEFPESKPLKGFNLALVNIFARYCEIIIQRLNQVPQKNFLAFLDLLGAAPLPPQPARVPLTFTLAAGSTVDAIVPAGTQVAAPPPPGEEDPVIFETERELVVTAVELAHIFVRDPQTDRFADLSQLTRQDAPQPLPVFEATQEIAHILYIGIDTFLGYDDLQALTLNFELEPIVTNGQPIDLRSLEWQIWDGQKNIIIFDSPDARQPSIFRDFTNLAQHGALTQSGKIVFDNLPSVPQQTVANISSRWLRCYLKTQINKSATFKAKAVRASQLPTINKLSFQVTVGRSTQSISAAFSNQLPIDLSKPFYPFGEKPKFGDTFYLAGFQAFANAGANVTLHLDLLNLENLGLQLPDAITSFDIELIWEIWTDAGWHPIGKSTQNGAVANFPTSPTSFEDLTQALTETVDVDRQVRFTLPQHPEPEPSLTIINGIENYWVRVRIARGNYGTEGSYVKVAVDNNNPSGFKFNPPTFKPPLIGELKVDYTLITDETDTPPDRIVTYNDFNYQEIQVDRQFKPFVPIEHPLPTFHLGLRLPESRSEFPNLTLSIYFKLAESFYQPELNPNTNIAATDLIWEYWNASDNNWQKLRLVDDTKALTRQGLLEFLPPAMFGAKTDFNLDKPDYWLRAYWNVEPDRNPLPSSPKIGRVLLNTILATQSISIRAEILGSSDGSENQTFNTTKMPVLPAQSLDVRELDIPSAADRLKIDLEEGQDAIVISRDLTGNPQEIWVRWHEVIDFYSSSNTDRHYVLNHLTGEIRFGNGISSKIPPIGTGNIRMTSYLTGGGSRGNCPAGSIVQLKTTIPYVDSVTNPIAAAAGADAETIKSLIDRAPSQIRHGGRAVTLEDYADLAIEASPEVARAQCFPLLNLKHQPFDVQNTIDRPPQAPGAVSVIIVPRSPDPKPLPSIELIERVQSYLIDRSIPTATIVVVGPLYIRFDVNVEVATISLQGISEIEQNINATLDQFLHPLTGGSDNNGWAFGRTPHLSDFYALLESISGIDHIRSLNITPIEDFPTTQVTKRFLVYSGTHTITFS